MEVVDPETFAQTEVNVMVSTAVVKEKSRKSQLVTFSKDFLA